jgi:hypothetical protein
MRQRRMTGSGFRCGEAGHQAANSKGRVGRCSECGKSGHKSAVCWKAHLELKPDWVTERGVAENQGLSAKVDKLAEQVAQLAQQVAALAGGRPIRHARQAELSFVEDEEPLNAGAAVCTGCEGCDLDRDLVVNSGGKMDPRKKFV